MSAEILRRAAALMRGGGFDMRVAIGATKATAVARAYLGESA